MAPQLSVLKKLLEDQFKTGKQAVHDNLDSASSWLKQQTDRQPNFFKAAPFAPTTLELALKDLEKTKVGQGKMDLRYGLGVLGLLLPQDKLSIKPVSALSTLAKRPESATSIYNKLMAGESVPEQDYQKELFNTAAWKYSRMLGTLDPVSTKPDPESIKKFIKSIKEAKPVRKAHYRIARRDLMPRRPGKPSNKKGRYAFFCKQYPPSFRKPVKED